MVDILIGRLGRNSTAGGYVLERAVQNHEQQELTLVLFYEYAVMSNLLYIYNEYSNDTFYAIVEISGGKRTTLYVQSSRERGNKMYSTYNR